MEKKIWYYGENYGTLIYVGKNMVDYETLYSAEWKQFDHETGM